MGMFKIDVKNLCWTDGNLDDPNDLCLHGDATALYLLKNVLLKNFLLMNLIKMGILPFGMNGIGEEMDKFHLKP